MSIIYPHRSQNQPQIPKTARHLYRRGFRPLERPVGKQLYFHAEPHHEMRCPAWPLNQRELDDLRGLFQKDRDAAFESMLYYQAFRARQITAANLYASCEKIVEPTDQ